MSDLPLPENLGDWPEDPYELLGIDQHASKTELRKAYVRLIRAYKPEFHPAEFQRIREAYDRATAYLSWQWMDREESASAEPADASLDAAAPEEALAPQHERAPRANRELAERAASSQRQAPRDPVEQGLEEAWSDATNGRPSDAHARLLALARQHGAQEEICLRLYWLLMLSPELKQSEAVGWLVAGLRHQGSAARLRELFRRHLEHDPATAITDDMVEILAAAPGGREVSELLAWRWEAASLLGRQELIFADVKQYQSRVARDDEGAWLQLLLSAIDRLCWEDADGSDEAFDYCVRAAEALDHLHVRYGDELLMLDLLIDARRDMRRLRVAMDFPAPWLGLLPLTPMTSLEHGADDLMLWCEAIAKDPRLALHTFDRLARYSPAVTARLGELVQRWSSQQLIYEHDSRDEELLIWQIRQLMNHFDPQSGYARFRLPLLQFCVRESINPGLASQAMTYVLPENEMLASHLAGQIAEDGTLQYVYSACRIFQG